ncbi:MAG: hypothetical protein SF187_23675 [Deltaproteobacteria bacterium]|nr:hypothetical protein [Deltaproteobacteria bacterium]
MQTEDIALGVVKVLSPIVLAAVTWVTAKLGQWINARVKNEYLRGVLARLDDTVLSVVREVHQVTVDALKASTVDGKLTPGARDAVKAAAIGAIKSHIGTKGLLELARVLGIDASGVERLIGTKIEAAVHDIKSERRVLNGVNHAAPALADLPNFQG